MYIFIINPDWKITDPLLDIVHPRADWEDDYDWKFWGLAIAVLPVFYFVYLPFVAPLMELFLVALVIMLAMFPIETYDLIGVDNIHLMRSVIYYARYLLGFGPYTPHQLIFSFLDALEVLLYNTFAIIGGWLALNSLYPLTWLACIYDIAMAVFWIMRYGLN